jgi:hypothetical protein
MYAVRQEKHIYDLLEQKKKDKCQILTSYIKQIKGIKLFRTSTII